MNWKVLEKNCFYIEFREYLIEIWVRKNKCELRFFISDRLIGNKSPKTLRGAKASGESWLRTQLSQEANSIRVFIESL